MSDSATRPGAAEAAAAAAIPDAFVDRSLERYQALAAPMRALLLALTGAGVLLSVVYIFGLAPLLDVTYYFLLMAVFLRGLDHLVAASAPSSIHSLIISRLPS